MMNVQEYCGGRINRIRLKNFMTYTYLEIFPIPGLNLMLGPNGSGKSTIMCALCLGLTGTPKYTGRPTMNLPDFLKDKKFSAFIELTLDGCENNDIIIAREILPNGKSRYVLNKEVVEQQQIEKAISKFNIQVSNLCQFLPQEKVSDFAKMNAKQLLESMQQAVGDQEMHQNYTMLLELQEQVVSIKKNLNRDENVLAQEKKKNDTLSVEIEKFEKRENYIRQLKNLKRQRNVFIYVMKKNEFDAQKKKFQGLNVELTKMKSSLEPLETEIEGYKNHVEEMKSEMEGLEQKFLAKRLWTDKRLQLLKRYDHKILNVEEIVERKLTELQQQKQRETDLKNQLLGYDQKRLSCLQTWKELESCVEENRNKLQDYKEKRWNLHSVIEQCHKSQKDTKFEITSIDNQINIMKDCDRKKLQYLQLKFPDTYKATVWLRDNRNLFSKHIYDPLLMLISVHESSNAKYLENHINGRDLIIFLCEDREDAKKFTNILRVQNNLAVNAAPVPNKTLAQFQPNVPLDELQKKYRFHYYLKDVFSAPEAAVAFLCDIYHIHNIPVGDVKTDSYIQSKIDSLPFFKFYTADNSYVCKKSLYGSRHTSVSTYQIRGREILGFMPNQKDLQNLEMQKQKLVQDLEKLKQEESQLCQTEHGFTKSIEQLQTTEKQFSMLGDQVANCEKQIQQIQTSLTKLQKKEIDVSEVTENAKSQMKRFNQEQIVFLSDVHSAIKECLSVEKQKVKKRFLMTGVIQNMKKLQDELQNHQKTLTDKEAEVTAERNKMEELKDGARHLMEKLNRDFNLGESVSVTKAILIQKIREEIGALKFREMNEIDNEINKLQAHINCICETDPSVIEDHRNRQLLIKEKEETVSELQAKLLKCHTKIKELKIKWLTPLEYLVTRISERFSSFFKTLNCAGEVTIASGEDPEDFDKYGLNLLVKFHDDARLRPLSQMHHSGGECSVATIIFILSLQELTGVPFRCVDEINQGMDSVNERRIFDLIGKSAENCSQYFLLTPKLLCDLDYSGHMKIHMINNGPLHHTTKHNNLRKILENRKKARM